MKETGKPKKFSLEDIDPRPVEIELLLEGKIKRFTVRRFTLRAQLWARREWGTEENLTASLDPSSDLNKAQGKAPYIEAIIKIMHFLLEDKETFPSWESLADAVGGGVNEILNLERAYLIVMGLSQPIADKNRELTKKKIEETVTRKVKKKAGT